MNNEIFVNAVMEALGTSLAQVSAGMVHAKADTLADWLDMQKFDEYQRNIFDRIVTYLADHYDWTSLQ